MDHIIHYANICVIIPNKNESEDVRSYEMTDDINKNYLAKKIPARNSSQNSTHVNLFFWTMSERFLKQVLPFKVGLSVSW